MPRATTMFTDGGTSCQSSGSGSNSALRVGADAVPNLSLPKTVLSRVDSLISAGGVIQSSSQNLTLYNTAATLRLLGGSHPHDELIGPDHKVLSSWLFWDVQVSVGSAWMTLRPTSSNFTLLGTNSTGTFVIRTLGVGTGSYSGLLRIFYEAASAGPMKWDLEFTSLATAHYRLVYGWGNLTGNALLSAPSKQLLVSYGSANYTLSWGDVPASLNTTATVTRDLFSLGIDLGQMDLGSRLNVDPSILPEAGTNAVSYTFQRKVFYEPKGGYYFVFYYDPYFFSIVYSYSNDGINWAIPQQMPTGWPAYNDAPSSSVFVANLGQTVAVAAGQMSQTTFSCSAAPCHGTRPSLSTTRLGA